ncbi:MAG: hypothetical protein ACRDC6_29900 [Shewanella sp.]|uniref:hypothetical protein n=1 Tax=Aeromonas veronii TaxID=654 RepID=UPI002B484EAE|nr:hypothetical protein [Aeromonas veronii]
MAVPNKPFWLSQANTEFGGDRWSSNILSKAGLSLPRFAGELAGKSSSVVLNLTIGEYSPGYETELGYRRGQMGAISIGQYEGKTINAISCYDDLPNMLYFSLESSTGKPIRITISGLGSAVIVEGSGTFNSIYSYFNARRGSVVQVTLAAA